MRKHRLDELDYPAAYLRRTMLNLVANERHRRAIQQRAMTRLAASRNSEETAQSYPSHLAELMRLDPRARAVLYSQAGALPAPMLDDVIGQVRAIDMDDVRRQIAEHEANQAADG